MKIPALFLLIALASCEEKPEAKIENDYTDRVINFAIEHPGDRTIEFPDLYSGTTNFLPSDKDENLILAEKLKMRGFKMTGFNRENSQLSGRRIVSMGFESPDCNCSVSKVYYSTANISEYIRTERIKCWKN
jgi:hypothetical protein